MASLVPEPIEKCAVCAASPMSTRLSWNHVRVAHAHEGGPRRRRRRRVRHQPVPVEPRREQRLAGRDRAVAGRGGRSRRARHDASSHSTMNVEVLFVEAVAVRLEHAVLVLDEVEREGLERQGGAEPDEPRRAGVEIGRELLGVAGPPGAVDAVGGDDHVRVRQARSGPARLRHGLGLEAQRRRRARRSVPEGCRAASCARCRQKPWPPEVMTRPRTWTSMSSQCAKPAVMRSKDVGVGGAEVLHRLVGEHDAPAERVVAAVALEHGDVGVGTRLLQQQRRSTARRARRRRPRPSPRAPC